MARILLEVAVESVEDAVCARCAGANRFELCAALDAGGLTPSIGMLRAVRSAVDVPVLAMIRPRAGGFCYNDAELATMNADIAGVIADGADGVVFGVLGDDFRVDVRRCKELLSIAAGRPGVFHRAFDLTPDPFESLEMLIDLGFQRVLTSGQCATACEPQAIELIGKLVERAAGRIEILPGSGLRAENVRTLIAQASCAQIHGAFRTVFADRGLSERGIQFGFGVPGAGDRISRTDETEVRAIRLAIDGLSAA